MLRITWKKGPDLPQGLQDNGAGIIGKALISVGGFCSGQKDVPGKPDKYPRGFLKKVWGLDLSQPGARWNDLPDLPAARRGPACVAVDASLYCWGGFNYTAPFSYRDGYRLSKQAGHWVWEPLPELPNSGVWCPNICAIGPKIYVFGGADYDRKKFYTHADRLGNNPRLGARLLMIDTADMKSGWKRLANCPGTPRWLAATASVAEKVYVLGGVSGGDNPSGANATVVDNWRYDPAQNQWERLRDLPVASGNFTSGPIVYKGRFILLIGGFQYYMVENPDGSLRKPYGAPYRHYKESLYPRWKNRDGSLTQDNVYCSDVWVYDTQTGLFGTASPLPLNNNEPAAVLNDSRIYLMGGETGGAVIEGEPFGHHPDLLLVGSIEETK
jgi:N-acetylneuraminic acid mutarotase